MSTNSNKGIALVTGASSGIGAVYADRLAKQGYDLILVARDLDRMKTIGEMIQKETKSKIDYIKADLTDRTQRAVVEKRIKEDAGITLLVNNAGIASTTPLIDSDVDYLESMIEINVISLTRLAHVASQEFVKRGKGTIINISSIVALSPDMLNGVYSGTKAFVLNLTQSMNSELKGKGVRVQAVLPGATSTELWERSGFAITNLPTEIVMSAGDMVDASLKGLEQGELVTIPSLPNQADWTQLDTLRESLRPNLSKAKPAIRYV